MPSPLVSVIMPVFNAAPFLGEAAASILSQTLSNLELIAVDDGSTDGSLKVLQSIHDPRLVVLRQEHAGVFFAMNKGIAAAQGEFAARMDADDIARPDRLALELELFQNSDADVAGACVEVFSQNWMPIPGFKKYETWVNGLITHETIVRNIFIEDPIPSPTLFLRRRTLLDLGGYDENVYPDDYNLTLKAFKAGLRFAKQPEKLLRWRDHPQRLSRTSPELRNQRFFFLKARFFRETFCAAGRELVIWGLGRNGKSLCKALLEAGVLVHGFTSSPEYIREKSLYGRPVRPFTQFSRPWFLLATAAKAGRASAEKALTEAGFEAGNGYTAFC